MRSVILFAATLPVMIIANHLVLLWCREKRAVYGHLFPRTQKAYVICWDIFYFLTTVGFNAKLLELAGVFPHG